MMLLVYIRIPTNKVAVTKHMTAHKTIHFSREYGLTKLGINPGGGRILGIFARAFASAMLTATRKIPKTNGIRGKSERRQRRALNDGHSLGMKMNQKRCLAARWVGQDHILPPARALSPWSKRMRNKRRD
jgi:hypothetical protein